MQGEVKTLFEQTKVSLNSVVKLRKGDSTYTVQLVEDDKQDLSLGKYGMSHALSKQILHKKAGDVFFDLNSIPKKELCIIEIKSEYLHALHETLNMYGSLFPEQEDFYNISMEDRPSFANPSEGMEVILGEADARRSEIESSISSYHESKVSVFTLSRILRTNVAKLYYEMLSDPQVSINCCDGGQEERNGALKWLAGKEASLILDITALLTLSKLDALNKLKAFYPDLYVCQTTLDALNMWFDELKSPPKAIFAKTDSGYILHEVTPENVEKQKKELLSIIEWLKINCSIALPTGKLKDPERKFTQLSPIFGAAAVDVLYAASTYNYTLLTDDKILRAVAHHAFAVNSVWSQIALIAILEKEKDAEAYSKHVGALLECGYDFTTLNHEILIALLRSSGWEITQPVTLALKLLAAERTDINSAILVSFNFLIAVWKHRLPYDVERKIAFATLALLSNRPELFKPLVTYLSCPPIIDPENKLVFGSI